MFFRTINTVVAGDYAGRKVKSTFFNKVKLCKLFRAPISVDETTVAGYNVESQESSTSGKSALCRGCLGRMFFGSVGMFAGVASAKDKTRTTISITFKNGDRSLIEVDQKTYKRIMRALFK